MSDNSRATVIQQGTEFDGKIKSDCNITLNGKLKGEVVAPALTVEPSGCVDGRVKVSELKSQGKLSGEIEAKAVELSGQVSDQTVIRANTLEVKLAQSSGGLQVTFGDCELQVGQKVAASGSASSQGSARESKDEPVGATVGSKHKPRL